MSLYLKMSAKNALDGNMRWSCFGSLRFSPSFGLVMICVCFFFLADFISILFIVCGWHFSIKCNYSLSETNDIHGSWSSQMDFISDNPFGCVCRETEQRILYLSKHFSFNWIAIKRYVLLLLLLLLLLQLFLFRYQNCVGGPKSWIASIFAMFGLTGGWEFMRWQKNTVGQ